MFYYQATPENQPHKSNEDLTLGKSELIFCKPGQPLATNLLGWAEIFWLL